MTTVPRLSPACRTPGCTASPKADHRALHMASDEALAATPQGWESYTRNMAELDRRRSA